MKSKQVKLTAILSIIFAICPFILNSLKSYDMAFLLGNSVRIAGCTLMLLFFFLLITRQPGTSLGRTAGILGLMGYLFSILLSIGDIISGSIFNTALVDPSRYAGWIRAAVRLENASLLISIIPYALIILCFILLFRNLKTGYIEKG